MSRPVPFARELRWLYAVPQLIVLAIAISGFAFAYGYPNGVFAGAVVYFVYSFGSRAIFARYHKAGIRLIRNRKWDQALPWFQKSQAYFEKYSWLDRYRQILLMSSSGASYHEMALINQAACQLYLDNGSEAKRLYERALELYPDSPLAEGGLRAMQAGRDA